MEPEPTNDKEGELRNLLLEITVKENRARNRSLFYMIIPILAGGLWLLFSVYQSQALKEESRKLSEEIEAKQQELKEVEDKVTRGNEILEAFASPEAMARRRAVNIQYVANSSVKERIETALRGLGFVQIRNQAGPANRTADTIRYGSRVNLDDVKLVAYSFTSVGVQIKDIKQFEDSSTSAFAIEVGSSKTDTKKPALTVQEIRDIGPFRRGNAFPVVLSSTDRNEAIGFARRSRTRFTPYPLEVYLAENNYYAVTLGGYLDQSEASKRVGFAKEKGVKDAYVWVSDSWGDNLLNK